VPFFVFTPDEVATYCLFQPFDTAETYMQQWIEGIDRYNGRLIARAVGQSGDRQLVPLADIRAFKDSE